MAMPRYILRDADGRRFGKVYATPGMASRAAQRACQRMRCSVYVWWIDDTGKPKTCLTVCDPATKGKA